MVIYWLIKESPLKNQQIIEIEATLIHIMVRTRDIDYDRVKELYEQGISQSEIGRILGTDRRNISRIVRHHIKGVGFDAALLDRVLELRQSGLSLKEINERLGTSMGNLGQIISFLQTRGDLPTNDEIIEQRNKEILQSFKGDAKSLIELSEKFDLSPFTIMNICDPPKRSSLMFNVGFELGYKKGLEETDSKK